MKTLLLDPATWDLTVDVNNNIAVASDPYAIAQDVASACQLYAGELWFDHTQGVTYFQDILGKRPSLALVKSEYSAAARTIPLPVGTVVEVFLSGVSSRQLVGSVQVKQSGIQAAVVF